MLIGLGHKCRQGKDTAGQAIVDYYNDQRDMALRHGLKVTTEAFPEARIFKFADELYRICYEEYGMKGKDAPLLQQVGNSRRQEFGDDYWINKLAPKIAAFKGIAVITDVRYRNEADWIKVQGGHVIEVRRIAEDGSRFVSIDRDPTHISETDLDTYNFDHYIITKNAVETGEIAITIAEFIRGLES